MLRDLYSELIKVHYKVQKHAADGEEREAAALLDTILDLEQRIVETPAVSLNDAAIKLRLLQMEIFGDITMRQRTMLREVLTVLGKASTQAAENDDEPTIRN